MSNSAGAQNAKAENGTQEVKKEPQEGEKNELLNLYRKRDELVKNLHDLEKQIYKFEESYLEDTQSYGNIVIGWENFNAESNRNRNKNDKKNQPRRIKNSDRIFSYSSVTTFEANPQLQNGEEENHCDDYPKHKKKKKA